MTISVYAAAKRLGERSGWSLSNLELQKILYIAHMFHIGQTKEPLVTGYFEAWDYGPVHPKLYHRVKIFGSSPVENIFHSAPEIESEEDAETLDSAVEQFGNARSGKLVAITHWDGGAWAKYHIPGERGVVIPNEAIYQEFLDRLNAFKATQQPA